MAARALINVPPKAKRGEIIGIKSLISHEMETGFRPNATGQLIPRNIIKEFVCTYNGVEVFRAEFFPPIVRQSVRVLHHGGDRERHHHHDLDRRQRVLRHRVGRHHRRMTHGDLAHRRCAARSSRLRHSLAVAEIPLDRTQVRLRLHGARDPRHAGRRHRQCRHAVGARRRGAVEPQGRRRRQVLRRLPWRRAHQHEGRGRALSRVQPGARPAGQSRAAHQHVPHRAASRRSRSPTRARTCWRSPRSSAANRAASRSRSRTTRRRASSSRAAAPHSRAGRASSISPARNATTTIGAAGWPAVPVTAGAADRLSDLSPGMAEPRLVAAAAAQLPHRHARGRRRRWARQELVELELYLMWRARGMPLETPGVRP